MLDPSLTKDWSIDPTKVAVRAFTYPHGNMPVSMVFWLLHRFPHENFAEVRLPDVTLPVARNLAVAEFLNHQDLDYLLLVDNDVEPDPRLDLMFHGRIPDLVCASWESEKRWYADRTCWHMTFALVKKDVFLAMEKPWFVLPMGQDGFSCSCDCSYFSSKAREIGFTTGNQGFCKHRSARQWCSK